MWKNLPEAKANRSGGVNFILPEEAESDRNAGTFYEPCREMAIMEIEQNGLNVHSTEFAQNGHIPPKYTCEGDNINPPLNISGVPEKAKALAIIMEDPDAPRGVFDHWLVWNISPNISIAENTNPGISGTNSFGTTGYGGPCPPSGRHRYYFKVYALDAELTLIHGSNKTELLKAMEGHVLAQGDLMGYYQKKKEIAHA
jgi:Raf kinase inhibitor-like YbhB/YbcL family protein